MAYTLPYQRIVADIEAGKRRAVYLLAGPDAFPQRAVVDALRGALVPSGFADTVELEMEGGAVAPADVVGAVRTPSLVGARLVLVRDAPWFAAARGRAAAAAETDDGEAAATAAAAGDRGKRARRARDPLSPLLEYLELPAGDAVLVLRSQLPADTRRKAVKRIAEVGVLLAATAPPPDVLPAWCVERASSAHGVTLDRRAAAMLCRRVPASLDLLDQELAKLAAFAGGAGTVAASDVEAIVAATRDERVFDLMDAVVEGRAADAFALIATLRAQGEQVMGLLALLARQVRLLLQAQDAVATDGRGAAASLAAASRLPPFVARRAISQARRFAAGDLEKGLEAIWVAERSVKFGRSDEETALAGAVGRLLQAGGAGRASRAAGAAAAVRRA